MNQVHKITDFAYKRQNILTYVAIFSAFTAVGFRVDNGSTQWIWAHAPVIACLLIALSLGLTLLWIQIEKAKLQASMQEIKNSLAPREKLALLTNRQLEIFELIAQGKSNKDIAGGLFIEFSTLKTHINKIYKTLEISSRKEARQYFAETDNGNSPEPK
jgi:DNA-binding CsgD family transcriptional regulator